MNIREFAKLCGVAHSTVSRVLNLSLEQSHVSRKTYDRIRAKAVEVGFHVNYYAQAFHSKTSNCLGFIASNRLPMLLEPLLYGISGTLDLQRKNLSLHLCDNERKVEAAFDKMLSYNADAVFYIPPLQTGESYSTRYMDGIREKYPHFPPVIVLFGGTNVPDFYQIRFHYYEIGEQAALRQLNCGCRKFGILSPLHSNFMNREISRGYRETLLQNGISPDDIQNFLSWPDGTSSEIYAQMKKIEGLWCSHYLVLLKCAPLLLPQIKDCRKLHIDSKCGIETETMYNQLQPIADSGKTVGDFRHGFGSMVLYQYKLEDIGIKAAETAFRLTQPGADSVPKISYIDLTQAVFGRERDQSFIFRRKKSSVFSGK